MSEGVAVKLPCSACGALGGAKKYRRVILGGLTFECLPPVCDACWKAGASELLRALHAAAVPNTPAEAPRFWSFQAVRVP